MGRRNRSQLRSNALLFLLSTFAPVAHTQSALGTFTSVPGTEACQGVTADPAGNIYIVDDHGVQKMSAGTSRITTVVSRDLVVSGGGIAVDAAGNLYIAQGSYGPLANTVKKVAAGTSAVTTVAGTGEEDRGVGRRIPGPATRAILSGPQKLALDSAGNLYVAEDGTGPGKYGLFKVAAETGVITGLPRRLYPAKRGDPVDPITNRLAQGGRPVVPAAFALDSEGNVYFSDVFHDVIWELGPDGGQVKRVAGTGVAGYSGDGGPALEAQINGHGGLAFDAGGNLYFADQGNNRIRMVAKSTGIIATVAGNGTSRDLFATVPGDGGNLTSRYHTADDGDSGPATQARITSPEGIAFDRSGNLYICSGILRKVTGVGGSQR